jgi:hypothetical protein
MKSRLATSLIFALLSGTLGCQQKAAGSAASKVSWSGTQKVEINDPILNMTAMTLEIPAGWRFAGTIIRPASCHNKGTGMTFTMRAQDGITSIIQLPATTWSWSTSPQMQKIMADGKCPAVDIHTAGDFLINIALPNLHPGAKVGAVLPLDPEGQASLEKQLAQMQQGSATAFARYNQAAPKVSLEGARVRVMYVRAGIPVEEMITTVITCSETQTPAAYKQAPSSRRICSTRGTNILRAPLGQLDEELAQSKARPLFLSEKVNPEWQQKIADENMAMYQKFRAQNDAIFKANSQRMQQETYRMLASAKAQNAARAEGTQHAIAADRANQAAIDNAAHQTVNYSLDRKDFVNPSTGQTINASSEYNHQWMSSDGSTLIQTNSPSLDPNGVVYPVSQSWTELIPK